ncbi:TPA: immunoglobulin-binding protein, partial [Escherichia coli]|nr:immunoglobulin-binding protein [Escherichia coli]
ANKSITDSTAGISWIDIDGGGQSLEEVTVIDRQLNDTGYNFAVGSAAAILDADKSMAVGNNTAVFNADNSVALGYGSQVNGESNVLSVGAGPSGYGVSVDGAPETRRIINVSDGVKDSDAATKGQMDNAIADAVRESGDALRGEIGAVYRDAVADAKSRVESAENRLNGNITAARASAQEYTDAVKSDVLDETRTYTDSSVRTVRNEVKSQAEHLSDVLVKNRAQTDAAIASNTAAIRNNSHRLDLTEAWQKMATERMNNMQEQIKENRKELRESAAQSAALAGLFQPYSVGKFNATAAVGGYRDEQAIAVGVGYRFTENVAGKVAVAAGGSSASWNAGVNFEF